MELDLNLLLVQLAVIFLPGIIWERLGARFAAKIKPSTWESLVRTLSFGFVVRAFELMPQQRGSTDSRKSKMTFNKDGFLSQSMEAFSTSLRNENTYRQWFDFARELNRFGIGILDNLQVPRHDNQRVTICALFTRAHQSFQAALILAERGMLSDARVVLRSAVEGAIAMHAIADDPTFIKQLDDAHKYNQRKMARLVLNNPDYKSSFSEKEIADLEKTICDIDEYEKKNNKKLIDNNEFKKENNKKLSDIKWANVALKHCKDLYDLLYRQLSSDGTHTNNKAIQRFLLFDKKNELLDIRIGPDNSDLVEVMKIMCLMFLWAAGPFTRVFQTPENITKLQKFIERFPNLPDSEPTNVTINPNYT